MFLEWAAAIVRVWTRLYTWRLPPAVRDTRRAEIESDLWESQHDPEGADGARAAMHVLLRCIAGVPDDLCWRREHGPAAGTMQTRVAISIAPATVITLVLAGAWAIRVLRPAELPAPPAVQWFPAQPAPPPPPPPPPQPRPTVRPSDGG